jgi:hypothetical protein
MHVTSSTRNEKSAYPRSITLWITGCFFFSGLAGLIYEVVWARQLSLFLGITFERGESTLINAILCGKR